jgi:hypothetical protein
MRKYHLIPVSGQETHCYNLPEENFSPRKQPKPDWNGITLVKVDKCPLRRSCVEIDDNHITRLCDFLSDYGFKAEQEPIVDQLVCKYGHKMTKRKVATIGVFDCPIEKPACLSKTGQCSNLEIIISINSERPHYGAGCALLEE